MGWLTLAICLWVVWDVTRGSAKVAALSRFTAAAEELEQLPRVSICFSARDEERGVRAAVASFLSQDYADFEVIAVNDRSRDATGAILDQMACGSERLRVIHVKQLPPNWLGKNHGLQTAAAAARGEWILFTDGDVQLAPTALRTAVNAAAAVRADHLAVGPSVHVGSWPLGVAVSFFLVLFSLYCRPWAAAGRGPWHVGVGAFNLVRTAAYRRIGGHGDIRMRPDDDMKLGKRLKMEGSRTVAMNGKDLVAVEWYRSLGGLVHGLEKNTFAGLEYRLGLVWLVAVLQFWVFVWPYVVLPWSSGGSFVLYAASAAAMSWLHGEQAVRQGFRRWYGWFTPFAAGLFLFILANSTLATVTRGGIDWRGTHYPLDQLRSNRVGGWWL